MQIVDDRLAVGTPITVYHSLKVAATGASPSNRAPSYSAARLLFIVLVLVLVLDSGLSEAGEIEADDEDENEHDSDQSRLVP